MKGNLLLTQHSIFRVGDYRSIATTMQYKADEPIANNQYTVDVEGVAHVKSITGTPGYFTYVINDVEIGDIIEVTCDLYAVAGDYPRIAIDEYPSVNVVNKNTSSRAWETVTVKTIVTKTKTHSAVIGILSGETGEAYIKNIRIKTYTKKISQSKFKKFYLEKMADGFVIKDGTASDVATLTVVDDQTLRLTYQNRIAGRTPIAIADGDFNALRHGVIPRLGYEDLSKVDIRFMRVADGTIYNLTEVPSNTRFKIAVFTD